MEPERPIEKLLRAFAKKRREQAGEPIELHPVARQQLQKEIARRAAETSGAGWFSNFFHGLRPRLAFALCFSALVVAGLIFLPNLRERKLSTLASANSSRKETVPAKKAEPAMAPPQVAPMMPAANERERVDQDKQPAVAANRQSVVAAEGAPKQAAVVQNKRAQPPVPTSVATASPAPSNAETRGFKNDRTANVATFGGASVADSRALSKDTLSPAPGGAAFFENSQAQAAAAAPPASQVFNRLDIPAGGRRAVGGFIAPTPVLASFRVEQTGNALRVVDTDGSVYTGAVQQVAQPASTARATAPKNAPAVASVAIVTAPAQAAQNYYFRVAGTNRNLNQNVIFSGNLIPLTNAPILTGAVGTRRALELPVESLLSNSRISGKAVIGDQKEIEVNATPAP